MPDILHRFTIDAPRESVHDLIATKEGVHQAQRRAVQAVPTLPLRSRSGREQKPPYPVLLGFLVILFPPGS